MSQIAVDFLAGSGLLSRCIEIFGVGANGYSHAASVLADGRYLDARNDKLGNVPPGIHIRNPKTEKFTRKLRATLEVTPEEYADWEASLRAKIGDAYAKSDILGFLLGENYHMPGHYECAALAINAIQHIKKVRYPFPFPAHSITPNSLLMILTEAGFTIGKEELA